MVAGSEMTDARFMVRVTHGWSTTVRRGEPTHDRAGRDDSSGVVKKKITTEKRRKDEWRRDVSHPDLGTASLRGMPKTPTARSHARDSF